MASVRPRLSPRLLLILTFTATEDTDWDTDTVLEDTTVDTVLATMASVRPRLSPRLLLILTFTASRIRAWDISSRCVNIFPGCRPSTPIQELYLSQVSRMWANPVSSTRSREQM